MAFDFDPFSHLDIDFNGIVSENDLEFFELQHGHSPILNDLNHDTIPDFLQQLDINIDGILDKFQVDIDNNSVIDKFEETQMGTKLIYDLNGDGKVDYIDEALARILF
jgi:hypothetical protein